MLMRWKGKTSTKSAAITESWHTLLRLFSHIQLVSTVFLLYSSLSLKWERPDLLICSLTLSSATLAILFGFCVVFTGFVCIRPRGKKYWYIPDPYYLDPVWVFYPPFVLELHPLLFKKYKYGQFRGSGEFRTLVFFTLLLPV